MKLRYVGPSGVGVELPLPDGRIVHVEHDGECPVELPADFAASLLEQQSNWQQADPAKPAKPKAAKEE